MMIAYVALLILVVAVAYLLQTRRMEQYTAPSMTFTQMPVNRTYEFASPIPASASEFDKTLGKATDARIPAVLVDGGGVPEPAPYTDSEVQKVAETALARAKVRALRYIATDYATKHVDALGNVQFDIAFMAYDMIKNFSVKIALVAVVAKGGAVYIKKFQSFTRRVDDPNAPIGTDKFQGADGRFVNDLGIDYVKLYG